MESLADIACQFYNIPALTHKGPLDRRDLHMGWRDLSGIEAGKVVTRLE